MGIQFGTAGSITGPLAVVLITAGLLTSCAGNPNSSNSVRNASGPQLDPTTTSQPSTVSNEVRPGCGTYCQNAGPIRVPLEGSDNAGPIRSPGEDSTPRPAATIVTAGTVTVDPDGYVPVTVTCNLPVQCNGALLIMLAPFGIDTGGKPTKLGRVDLLIDPGATRTFGIALPAEAIAYLRSHGPTNTWVTADTALTTPAGCEDIPALESMCPIDELAGAELTITAAGSR